ncbi:MAG: WecB/TagA/CpsF family glycosyltransferase [Candidatus Eremiobacteraeota bacterium]|nr:WecB/TagA/CpsF family glycosyltransferase [Candidatus Eremiobacteraeota bacterium]
MSSAVVLGCRVDTLGSAEAVRRIVELASRSEPSLVVTIGTEMIVRAQSDARFRDIVNASAFSLCDTIGVLFAARLNGAHVPERVAGVDIIEPLCEAFARDGIPVYFLGAKGDTAERAANALRARHPRLIVAGARDGYFSAAQNDAVADAVRASGARAIFTGLGSPRQELWLAERLARTGCSVGLGVGGSFDVLAGNVRRAPMVWRRLNLEWLYRLFLEPQRWKRQLSLPYFVWLVVRERVARGSTRRYT